MPEVLTDKFERKVNVLAKVRGERRRVLKLQLVKTDPRGRIHAGKELANKYLLVMYLEPIEEKDLSLIKAVFAKGVEDDGTEDGDDE